MKDFKVEHKGNGIKMLGKIIGYVALYHILPRVLHSESVTDKNDRRTVSYYDAVDVIMDSNMFASEKREAVKAMKRDGSKEYYKSIIGIIN
jgi:hypothetical protein